MVEKIAYRVSASVLLVTALLGIAILVMGLTRGDADPAETASKSASESPAKASAKSAVGSTAEPTAPVAAEPEAARPLMAKSPVLQGIIEESPEPVAKAPANDKFVVKRILQIDEPFVHGYYKWDDEGVPEGELVVTVDLKAESISVFRAGYEIGAAVITFGDSEKPTPTGVFPITQKSKDHVSNIYGSPMPYMLRLTNDGVAIHASDVKWGWGTRGCIGVPMEFARRLFEQATLGDRVIVTNGKMMSLGDAIL